MKSWSLVFVSAVACVSTRTEAPGAPACAGDRRASVENRLSVPIDIRSSDGIIGTVQPGEQAEFSVPRYGGVSPSLSGSATGRYGLNADDRKRVFIQYACADK